MNQKWRDYGASVDRDRIPYAYAPYGDAAVLDGSSVSGASSSYDDECRFSGRNWDAEIGLYYYRARYYHSQLGRLAALVK